MKRMCAMKPFIRMMILLAAGMMLGAAVGCAPGVASALPPASAPTAVIVQSTPTPAVTVTDKPQPVVRATAAPPESLPLPSDSTLEEMSSQVIIKSLVLLSNWQMGLTFEFEQPISDEYSLEFDHTDIQYDCSPRLAYNQPQRLFCSGRQPAMLETVSFTLVRQADNEEVFQGSVFIPAR